MSSYRREYTDQPFKSDLLIDGFGQGELGICDHMLVIRLFLEESTRTGMRMKRVQLYVLTFPRH